MTKNILFSLVLSFFTLISFSQKTVEVNTDASRLMWTGSKLTSSHQGEINLKSGALEIKDGKLVGGTFVIDMTSIKNTDIEDEEYRTNLEKHLKDEDFFGVDKHPESRLKITKAIPNKINPESYKITADLTIKEITHSITFGANIRIDNDAFLATSIIKFDRTKWDIKYNSKSFFEDLGDYMILDEIELKLFLLSEK
ncbi:MAG: YceI family protein [Flavobacteriales bacterium]|nr:YceI family protein [Flavobacteriales bacterium]